MDMGRGEERVRCMERVMYGKSNVETYITICKIDSQWEFAVWLRKLKQGLCINLEGWSWGEDGREFQKGGDICIIDPAKAFNCVGHNKLCKILKEMGIPDHPPCPLRNLYAGQEATVGTGHGTRLVPNQERSTSRLCTVTLLI